MNEPNIKKPKQNKRTLIPRIILLVLAIFLLIAIIILGNDMVGSAHTSEPNPQGQSSVASASPSDSANAAKPQTDTPAAKDPKPDILTLTNAERHTGDLILVNSSHAYDFDANADTVQLTNIKEHQSISYPVDKEEFQVAARMLPHLDEMIAACNSALNVSTTSISSAYRSREYQQNVWNETEQNNGADYANKYVSVPGFSEHHTGLAVDLGITNSDGSLGSFSESQNAIWMDEHSWEYGFVRRFKEDKVSVTGISNESWHFRYIGVPHAAYMKEQNLALEEYIDYLRNNTSETAPLTVTHGGQTWTIYHTAETSIPKPNGNYEISGDNIDGCIITIEA